MYVDLQSSYTSCKLHLQKLLLLYFVYSCFTQLLFVFYHISFILSQRSPVVGYGGCRNLDPLSRELRAEIYYPFKVCSTNKSDVL